MRLVSQSGRETKRLAARILRRLVRSKRHPLVLALSGELGSGKTTFIQGLAQALGIREKVQSPTFVLMRWYRLPRARRGGFRHLVHVDAYRLGSLGEARHLGLKDIFKDRDAIVVVEWAERIRKVIPPGAVWLRFIHGKRASERVIKISNFQ